MTTAESYNIKPNDVGEPLAKGGIWAEGLTEGKGGRQNNEDGFVIVNPNGKACSVLAMDGMSAGDGFMARLLAETNFRRTAEIGNILRPGFVQNSLVGLNTIIHNYNHALPEANIHNRSKLAAGLGVVKGVRNSRGEQVPYFEFDATGDLRIALMRAEGFRLQNKIKILTADRTGITLGMTDEQIISTMQQIAELKDVSLTNMPNTLAPFIYYNGAHSLRESIGHSNILPLHNYRGIELKSGDVLLFMSDGVWGATSHGTITQCYSDARGDLRQFNRAVFSRINANIEQGIKAGRTPQTDARVHVDDKVLVSVKYVG